ncbi:GGDEF domain-containing protein [Photobacterium kishitanii]|uniref:GGDEF domain-containing protein n=1 Tax=Photobacterium kishitanii TaxID=318456 RepID=UPI0015E6E29B|nr:GGDEF domain-containing protein [Photobacterium kishitanii]
MKKEKIEYEIENLFGYLTDSIYRYQISVINTSETELDRADDINGLLFIGDDKDKVKLLSIQLQEFIRVTTRNAIVGDNLWTVASVFPDYMYIYPFKKGYEDLFNKKNKTYFDYLVDIENIDIDLTEKGLSIYESMKVAGPYIEDATKEKLITIYYPLYNNKIIESILLLDFKYDFLDEYVMNFNCKNLSFFKLSSNLNKSEFIFDSISNHEKARFSVSIDYLLFLLFYFFTFLLFYLIYLVYIFFTEQRKDKLTGFYRKDFINKKRKTSCMIIIDIDFFKKINDNHGHAVGDLVIREVSNRIRKSIRKTDIAIRWGGEEFVILFDDLFKKNDLKVKLNELLKIISNDKIESLNVTISIGAFISSKKMNISEAFICADKALYNSKNTGRNKCTIYDFSKDR